jgi:hypothetical protein
MALSSPSMEIFSHPWVFIVSSNTASDIYTVGKLWRAKSIFKPQYLLFRTQAVAAFALYKSKHRAKSA